MLFFAAVAAVLLLLRAGGATIGWGFQLQSPWFVALLAYLLFVMGLSFSGFLEFGTSFMGVGNDLTKRTGYVGSFFTGALAAVVASPCTAPFMGSAIAFALGQSTVTALSVFLALGFGMALPFLLISCIPSLARLLPRPGAWMNILRQFMAFPLYLTSIWLLWVLGRQTDASGMAATLGGMLLLAFGIWVLKLRAHTAGHWRRFVEGLTVAATLGAFAILHLPLLNEPALGVAQSTAESKLTWEPYSAERLAELRAENKPVFVNMTADWCISCIANERVALSFPAVRRAFAEKDIVRLKGDWTSRDPSITKVLQAFGREGVPLYVVYPVGQGTEPMVLPQFLTPGIVLDALSRATGEKQAGDELRDGYPSALQSPI
jgi:thiol:disulfide interchange protein DsbD